MTLNFGGDSVQTDPAAILHQQVLINRFGLIGCLSQSLLADIFTNRYKVRPAALSQFAQDHADAFIAFIQKPSTIGKEHGARMCKMGLSPQSVTDLGKAMRHFLIPLLEPLLGDGMVLESIDVLDNFQGELMIGYIAEEKNQVLAEQTEIHSALQKAIGLYTIQLKEVQGLAQKAYEASSFKSRLIAQISHELRTPLGGLMGIAEMLEEGVFDPLTPRQMDPIMRINANARILQRILNQLLEQSHIESGQVNVKIEQFSPQELVQGVYSNQAALALRKKLALRVEVDPALPAFISGDKIRITQILNNLIDNAIKYTERGSVLVRIYVSDASHWALQVRDTGQGIPTEYMDRIYEPFWQMEYSIGKNDGVGLGLSIVKQLVELMSGKILVESKLGVGSTFTVILPY